MKKISIIFLQAAIVLFGIVALAILIRFPLTEGRAANLDLFSIYTDPFILYGYAASIAFFVALYKAFKLLGYIGQNKVFSSNSVGALKSIKYCAIVLTVLIVTSALYIRISHNKDDDPAGFIAICIVATFVCIVVATAAAIFQKILQNAIDMKSENDLTIWAMPIIVNLDVMMAKRKISLNELSERVDLTLSNLSILKTGKAKAIRFSTLDAICKALDCQPGDILEYVNDKKRRSPVT
jgi:DNA-binding Xre family transcriptional regulator